MSVLKLYNSYTRQTETFEPIHPPFVGLYVCGPTVYGEAHLGHARPYVTFDVLSRYLAYLGYKVRYVRNITDVGHLVGDADEGESKIEKKARLEKVEPMEVVQHYTIKFREAMTALNCLPPAIEPTATGHILEQIEMVQKILDEGYAYVADGSVYFDIEKYSKKYPYGKLSGRIVEDLLQTTRELDGQSEKRNKADFALWKNATPDHIMHWKSPWGEGFPGWHIECSAMSSKYLGDYFDIHGGGMDLLFPHHESEIAQSTICHHHAPVKYWMHCNMITYNGQKMGKSLGNAIDLFQFFKGTHPLLTQPYSPMTIRFFILQTHYRSTLDFSNEALQAAERGYQRLMQVLGIAKKIQYEPNAKVFDAKLDADIKALALRLFDELNDDLNTAKALATLFELSSTINSIYHTQIPAAALSEETFNLMKENFVQVCENIFGLLDESAMQSGDKTDALIKVFIDMRRDAKASKDFATSDKIRNALKDIGVQLKDNKDGSSDYIIE